MIIEMFDKNSSSSLGSSHEDDLKRDGEDVEMIERRLCKEP